MAKVLEVRDQLPDLKAIIQYTGEPTEEGVISWSKLLMIGQEQDDSILEDRLKQIAINQCCTLIYTSGTTGNPKGVMLSHDNLTWTSQVMAQFFNFRDCWEEYISFLPLSHVAAQLADIYCPMSCCATVYYGDKNALKGSLIETMREIKPTKFLAVPRVWEKMYEKMQEIGRSTTGVKKTIATWAKAKGLEYNMKRMNGSARPESVGFRLANKLILTKIRDALGLTRCDLHLSGAAPISQEILKYFFSLNIVVTEVSLSFLFHVFFEQECGANKKKNVLFVDLWNERKYWTSLLRSREDFRVPIGQLWQNSSWHDNQDLQRR